MEHGLKWVKWHNFPNLLRVTSMKTFFSLDFCKFYISRDISVTYDFGRKLNSFKYWIFAWIHSKF